jgi:hypothetical protein
MKIAVLLTLRWVALFAAGMFAALCWWIALTSALAVAVVAQGLTLACVARALEDEVEDALNRARRAS